jgi:hypothetical protein
MFIYLAGIYHSGGARPGSRSAHLRVHEKLRYPFVLESFHYANERMTRLIRHNRQKIFLDSGAFSMFTQGVRVNIRRYADFIRENADIVEIAANLDLIGPSNEQWSYQRQKALQTLLAPDGLDRLVIPVHHVRDHDDWLKRYLDDGYNHVCLGGMVPESTSTLQRWLDYVWPKFLSNPDGTAKVRVHGFGLTSRQLMFRYPWASIDSTAWHATARYGGLLLDFAWEDGTTGDFIINFSERSPQRFVPNSWHYQRLRPSDKRAVDLRLEQLEAERIKDPEVEAAFKATVGCEMGFNAQALSKSYGVRALANIGYFHRAMQRGIDRFEDRNLR